MNVSVVGTVKRLLPTQKTTTVHNNNNNNNKMKTPLVAALLIVVGVVMMMMVVVVATSSNNNDNQQFTVNLESTIHNLNQIANNVIDANTISSYHYLSIQHAAARDKLLLSVLIVMCFLLIIPIVIVLCYGLLVEEHCLPKPLYIWNWCMGKYKEPVTIKNVHLHE
jgi:cytochrome bd-type quinol oxidase subunit 2